jgi:ABC-2 type transport system permease protein
MLTDTVSDAGRDRGAWPSSAALVVRQVRAQLLTFRRTPIALFFTIMLPLVMLVLFNALFGDDVVQTDQGPWPINQFYTGGLAAFTAVSATYTNLANMVPLRREEGVLKRWRGTPLSPAAYLSGFVGSAIVVAVLGAGIMLGVGVAAYDLEIEAAKVPAMIVTFLVGVFTFSALGLAVAGLIPNARSAPAVANATLLPLAFVSNIFIPIEDPPQWMETLGDIFPLKPFTVSFQDTLNPLVEAPAFNWAKLGYVALWGIAGAIVAIKFFRWESVAGGRSTRGRRPRRQASA